MLSLIIWIIEFINVVMNAINANDYFNIAKEIGYNSNYVGDLGKSFSQMGAMCVINIIVSIIFCLAITIAYERSKSNKDKIEILKDYINPKKSKTKNEIIDSPETSELYDWMLKVDNLKNKNSKIEVDDNIENLARKDECPICFYHIEPQNKQCPNCGTKLKK